MMYKSAFLFPAEKFRRLERGCAEMFQSRALPFIDEKCFVGMYGEDNS
ncbi:hypothetical protein ACFLTZ_05500 [Chloroflexota bacterium]